MDERDELRSSVDNAEYGRMDAQRKLAAAERCVCSLQSLRSHCSVAHLTLASFLCLSLLLLRSSKELEEKLKGVEDRTSCVHIPFTAE